MIKDRKDYLRRVDEAADYIRAQLGEFGIPEVLVVLGSGLGPLADFCERFKAISYKDIPNFPVSTAPGHEGLLIAGTLSGSKVFMMKGRFHYYEGYEMEEVTFYVRVMGRLGVKTILLTNAAGGIDDKTEPPYFVAIEDHLSFGCESVLRGPNIDEFGTRFPDQCFVYDKEYLDILTDCARDLNIPLRRGIYAYSKGPQYETPAEIRALKLLGASCVGMSTVPEAIAASHMGMKVVCFSCVTNMAAGLSGNKLTEEEVLINAGKASSESCDLAKEFISRITTDKGE
ncbi:MAG: purine-nucleoside phosphorylase [Saccharofermentans sp.]|nr:purine-nucleoside phosphorylase [Saccharofermentans sp.]